MNASYYNNSSPQSPQYGRDPSPFSRPRAPRMSDSYDSYSDSSSDDDRRHHRSSSKAHKNHGYSSDSSDDHRDRYRHSGGRHRSSSKTSSGGRHHGHGHGHHLGPAAAAAAGGLTKLKHVKGLDMDEIPTDKRRFAADKAKSLTKAAAVKAAANQIEKKREKDARAVSDSEYRERRRRRKHYYNSDSDDSDDDDSSDDDSEDDSSSDGEPPGYGRGMGGKGDMNVSSKSNDPKRPKTRLEKKVDDILDALGLLHIKNDPSRRQLASPDPEKYAMQKQALQAAVTAAAIEAWRSHSKPGGFNLQKVIRIVVAAIAAGGVDVLVEGKPGQDNNRVRDVAEAVVGGLATSKALGGKITHRREGGAQGKMIDGFIALAASKMVKPPKPDEIERRKRQVARSRSMEPSSRGTGQKQRSGGSGGGGGNKSSRRR